MFTNCAAPALCPTPSIGTTPLFSWVQFGAHLNGKSRKFLSTFMKARRNRSFQLGYARVVNSIGERRAATQKPAHAVRSRARPAYQRSRRPPPLSPPLPPRSRPNPPPAPPPPRSVFGRASLTLM